MIVAALQGALRSASEWLNRASGRPVGRQSADRQYLEQQLLPAYARRTDVHRVLFVGCARYTRDYEALFCHGEYWTIDPVRRRARWGACRHVVDRLERLGAHVPPAYFDLIVCNGVLGWGLNRQEEAEAAFAACHAALRAGGELVIGWNDVRPRNAVRPDNLESLRRFSRARRAGEASQLRIDGPHRHVFDFYRRGADVSPHGLNVVSASGPGAQAARGLQAPPTQSS